MADDEIRTHGLVAQRFVWACYALPRVRPTLHFDPATSSLFNVDSAVPSRIG